MEAQEQIVNISAMVGEEGACINMLFSGFELEESPSGDLFPSFQISLDEAEGLVEALADVVRAARTALKTR